MEKRAFGKTGLHVTTLGHGAMEIRGSRVWGGRPVTDDEASRILNAVLDAGINFIDTSYDYGMSEEYIGKHIRHRRGDYYLATKCGCTLVNKGDHDDTPHVWTRANLLHNIETSLRRMNTDHVDLWQLHNPSVADTRAGDLVAVLQEVKRSGKALHIGISSTLPHIAEYIRMGVFESFQIPYSALDRRHEVAIAAASRSGAGVIVRGGVARGEPGAGLGTTDQWTVFDKARLGDLLSPGEDRTAFLLRFTITHPGMHTTIVGTRNPDHLARNVRAVQAGRLPADVYEEAKRRLAAAGVNPEPLDRSARPKTAAARPRPAPKAKPKAKAAAKRKASAKVKAKAKPKAKVRAAKRAPAKRQAKKARKPVARKKVIARRAKPAARRKPVTNRKPAARKRR